jgi:hypothetical protein
MEDPVRRPVRSPRSGRVPVRGVAAALLAVVAGCGAPDEAPRRPRVEIGPPTLPGETDRALGPAVDVAVAGEVVLACRQDGTLSVAGAGPLLRVRPPEGERFRRVAARGGRILALSARGVVHVVDFAKGTTVALEGRTQGVARIAMDPGTGTAWIGIEGGALFRVAPTATAVETAWPSGDEPVTAITAAGGHAFVARGSGTVEWTPGGPGSRATLATAGPSLTAMGATGRGLALADAAGEVRFADIGRDGAGPWRSVSLGRPVRALAAWGDEIAVALPLSHGTTIVLLGAPDLVELARRDLPDVVVTALAPSSDGGALHLATPEGVATLPLRRSR